MSNVLKKKKFWIILVIILIIGGIIYAKNKNNNQPVYNTVKVMKGTLMQNVSATGKVESATETQLNFNITGNLVKNYVKEGNQVKIGQVLAVLDSSKASSVVASARAQVAQAQADLDSLLAGSSNEEIVVAQTALTNAQANLANTKAQQDTAVANAYSALLNTTITAISRPGNIDSVIPTITGIYTGTETGTYIISLYQAGGLQFLVQGLEQNYGYVSEVARPLGTKGLNIQFSSTPSVSDSWIVYIPNVYASTYVTNNNAYQAALKARDIAVATAEAEVATAQANLDLKKASPRNFQVQLYQAKLLQAQANLQKALSDLADYSIKAPQNGLITKVAYNPGEAVSPSAAAIKMIGEANFQIKVDVPESDIAKVQVGNMASITLDAFGPDKIFPGHVSFIEPAATTISDVVYYKVTVAFDQKNEMVKSDMTANVDLATAKKDNVLIIPSRSITENSQRQKIVKVMVGGQPQERPVTIGLRGDEGLVEVLSGLTEGEEVITFVKQ